jgi:hypothetical protein
MIDQGSPAEDPDCEYQRNQRRFTDGLAVDEEPQRLGGQMSPGIERPGRRSG